MDEFGDQTPVWVILLAAGSGNRFGAAKQFAELAGRQVVDWSLSVASAVADGVVLVLPPIGTSSASHEDGVPPARNPLAVTYEKDGVVVVDGGDTRSASVRAGLCAVPMSAGVVVVHDAARPLASPDLFRRVIGAVIDQSHPIDGVVPALPLTDTVKRVIGDRVLTTVDRGDLVGVQTPQAFRAGILRAAHAGDPEATDDAALLEALGATVRTVPGEPTNFKITDPTDLVVAGALVGL